MEFETNIKSQIAEMEELLYKTHDMVQKMYAIVVGNDDYKEGSIISKVKGLEDTVKRLHEDKIRRDANIKLIGFASGVVGSIIGAIVALLSHFISFK